MCRLSLYIARMDAGLHVLCAPVTLDTWLPILATFYTSLMNMAMFVRGVLFKCALISAGVVGTRCVNTML